MVRSALLLAQLIPLFLGTPVLPFFPGRFRTTIPLHSITSLHLFFYDFITQNFCWQVVFFPDGWYAPGGMPMPPRTVSIAEALAVCACRGRCPRRPAGYADTPFTGACRAASPLAAAEGSRPLPANLPQKGLQRQSYGPGMPGPYRTAKKHPCAIPKRRRGVAYPCKIRPAYTAGR